MISKILTALIFGSFLLLVNCHSYKINKNKIEKSSNVIDCLSMHYCMVSGSIAIDFFLCFLLSCSLSLSLVQCALQRASLRTCQQQYNETLSGETCDLFQLLFLVILLPV